MTYTEQHFGLEEERYFLVSILLGQINWRRVLDILDKQVGSVGNQHLELKKSSP